MNLDIITIGAISVSLALIVGIWRSFDFLQNKMEGSIRRVVSEEIGPLNTKVAEISDQLDAVEIDSLKNFLVSALNSIDHLDELTRQRFYEALDRYEKLGGNSYIHARVEELRKKNVI